MERKDILKQYFGYDAFRNGQEEIIDAVLSGRDVMGIMPTGGGKSLCYQVPALMLPGITLVVSPLISLMKDQVAALKDAGVDAAFINSSLNDRQMKTVYSRLRENYYKIAYVAPERLEGEGFTAIMKGLNVSLVAIDEAHCISQWGQDFRPSYLKITRFLEELPRRPVVAAFTATATNEVRKDIMDSLQLRSPLSLVTGFDRPNLFFDVVKQKDKLYELKGILEKHCGKSGIVYCATRTNVERVCESLTGAGYSATRYHAGLSDEERRNNQDDFQYDRKTVMVATNAFGMGIDKSNVSFVIHYNMPKSLEAYYQEAGRAGRDGERADCILMYSAGDIATARYMIQNSSENSELEPEKRRIVMQQDYKRLDIMTGYCKSPDCLRGYILNYFGQEHSDTCENCGNCNNAYSMRDITVQSQMILSCVRRARSFLGYSLGSTMIAKILQGSREKRIMELRLDRLTTHGLMDKMKMTQIREYIDILETQGYLRTNPEYSTLELTEKSADVLHGEKIVEVPIRAVPERPKKIGVRNVPDIKMPESPELFDALRAVRASVAHEENVPAYIVFSNASLSDMAAKRPHTIHEFLGVSGVGEKKADRYGKIFLDAIYEFELNEK